MVDLSETGDVAIDRIVVRRVRKTHICASILHYRGIGCAVSGIATADPVTVQNPQVTGPGDLGFCPEVRDRIGRIRPAAPGRCEVPIIRSISLISNPVTSILKSSSSTASALSCSANKRLSQTEFSVRRLSAIMKARGSEEA